jgi:hypothetical protein
MRCSLIATPNCSQDAQEFRHDAIFLALAEHNFVGVEFHRLVDSRFRIGADLLSILPQVQLYIVCVCHVQKNGVAECDTDSDELKI